MAASFSITSYTSSSITIKIKSDSTQGPYYRVFCRLTSDTSDITYDQFHTVSSGTKTVTISGLKASTSYTINVGWDQDSDHTGGVTWIGGKTQTTSASSGGGGGGGGTTYYLTIKYNANGGSGAPSNQKVTGSSSSLSIKLSTVKPTRSGYTFLGWATSNTATSAKYSAGGTYTFTGSTVSSASQTIYAVWQSNATSDNWSWNYSYQSKISSSAGTYNFSYSLNAGQVGFCLFTPTSSGTITIYSDSTADTYGYLVAYSATPNFSATNASGLFSNYYVRNDDGHGNGQFGFTYEYEAGDQYLIAFSHYQYNQATSGTIHWTITSSGGGGGGTTTYTYDCYDTTNNQWIDSETYETDTTATSITRPSITGYTYTGYSVGTGWTPPGVQYTGTTCTQHNSTNRIIIFYYTKNSTSRTYYAKISYNANGGSGAPSSHTSSGTSSSVSVTLSSTTPTRSGYTFLGWSTNSSATSATYSAGGTYTFTGSTSTTTTTLYAVWKQTTYSVTINYNANNGTGAPSSQTQTGTSSSISVTLSSIRPTRTGYNFLGWATSSNATSATYQPGTAYSFTGSTSGNTVTLYAVWQAIYTATISYNANGGSGAPSSHSNTSTSSTSVSITLSSTAPTRNGYNFLGWSTSQTATTATYQPGTAYNFTGSISGTTTTLYAVWSQITYKVTINYNANGGSGAPSNQTQVDTTTNVSVKLSATTPTRTNYDFLGWATSNTATTATYNPNTSYTFTGSTSGNTITLYAVWKKKSNVYYRINGEWKLAYAYIRKNGEWIPIQTKVRNNSQWKG